MDKFAQLYQLHGQDLLRYLQRTFQSAGSAEDLLHETFVQAMRRSDDLARVRSIRAWLFGVARHVGLAAVRHDRIRKTCSLEIAAPHPVAGRPEGLPEDMELVIHAVMQLPEHLQEVMTLRLREELSYDEIAEALDIPVGTVRSRMHAAMIQLRERLGNVRCI